MRFVPIKTDDQLDLQSLHRVRERWVDASYCSGQPDSWLVARARHHSAEGTMPCGCSVARPYGSKKPMRWFRRPHRRAKSVDASTRFLVSVRLQQQHLLQPSGTERPFARAESSQRGLG